MGRCKPTSSHIGCSSIAPAFYFLGNGDDASQIRIQSVEGGQKPHGDDSNDGRGRLTFAASFQTAARIACPGHQTPHCRGTAGGSGTARNPAPPHMPALLMFPLHGHRDDCFWWLS